MATVANDVVSEKYGRAFDLLDADKDGYLDWKDYQALSDRFISAYKLDKTDRRTQSLAMALQVQWLELLRHANVDGERLNRDQYVSASRLATVDTSRINYVDGTGHAFFDVIDSDGDNEISKEEFLRLLTDVWKVTDPAALDVFVRIDNDGDGAISRSEFIRTIREYYLSSDPEAPGSVIFGQI
ncbi:EF-hand domain-containing protein [Streptomyces sp. NPDC012751]|uniref:EF-hand domain-containing protein n=1 Tax=Streptomyces sp. NPDC012751 TaxID=3364846 RepID=UPI0036B70FD5